VTSSPPERASGPSSEVVVRELRWSDFDAIRDTYYLLYEEREVQKDIGITLFDSRPSHENETDWFAGLYRHVITGTTIVVVAERDGQAIGHCTVRCLAPSGSSEAAHVGELGILVHRDHRGTGVGRALLTAALRQCRGKFEIVRLSVFSVNQRARRLYEEFGFVYIGTVPRAVHRGDRYLDEDLMFLDLGRAEANR